ncbi:hypothetical protein SAMN05660657_05416 [Geodermatophilus amargosae]|uniref:Uncharacterized protein n=1 Tax=Geodermatophilus amargosae TaxID=1296565 RepID=A0A1I7D7N6_9ACTN|nr:hypothetical protein [Geodermatophilus amargosae]SFU07615.1 hypothetical protein SAMN05660657_05416 [Geodermatophilus amargosae]
MELVGQGGGRQRADEVGRLAAETLEQDEQDAVQDVGDTADGHEPGELCSCVAPQQPVEQRSGGRLVHTSIVVNGGPRVVVRADPLPLLRTQ